jgi:methionyl aminopeptidase
MIPIKTAEEIQTMARAGRILAAIMDELAAVVRPGAKTVDFEIASQSAIRRANVKSAFKGYHGYPASVCVSVNEEVVHGIPGSRKIQSGDIVSLDIGIECQGFFVDMARTFPVGAIEKDVQRLIDATRESLDVAVRHIRPGAALNDICGSIQDYVEQKGFSVVREFVGHGIGRALHEEPQIPNYRLTAPMPVLSEGMVLAVEPMVNMGGWEIQILKDGWTAVTKDRKPSAHFEHTIAVVRDGARVLTQ